MDNVVLLEITTTTSILGLIILIYAKIMKNKMKKFVLRRGGIEG